MSYIEMSNKIFIKYQKECLMMQTYLLIDLN